MADTLIDSIRRILLNSRTGTVLTVEQIAAVINEHEEPSAGEAKTPVTPLGIARALLDYLENQSAPLLDVTVKVKLKKPHASFSIGGQRVSRRVMLEYLKLQKNHDKPGLKPGKGESDR